MRVTATRGHFVDGRRVAVGEVYDTRDTTARELISFGKAAPAPSAPALAPEAASAQNALQLDTPKRQAPSKRTHSTSRAATQEVDTE